VRRRHKLPSMLICLATAIGCTAERTAEPITGDRGGLLERCHPLFRAALNR